VTGTLHISVSSLQGVVHCPYAAHDFKLPVQLGWLKKRQKAVRFGMFG
jgi:hypothetical protein